MRFLTIPGFNAEAFLKYFKNTSWLLLARVGSLVVKMLVTTFLLPNYLGASLFGTYSYCWTYLVFFLGICTLGTDGLVTRELLQRPVCRDQILGSAFRLRVFGGLMALPLIYGSYFLISDGAAVAPAASFSQIALVSVICLVQSTQIIDSYYQSKALGKIIMFVQVGGNILSALTKAILVWAGASISFFIASLVLDVLILQLGYLFFYRHQGLSVWNWKFDPAYAKKLLYKGWPLALSAIFVSLYMSIDQLMIDAILGAEQLGIYSTVVRFSESWYFIPVAVCTALFPAIMNFRKTNDVLYKRRMSDLYELLVVLSLGIATVITILSPWLYDLFYAGRHPEYLAGSRVLQVHIWSGVFAFVATGSSQYLIAEGLTKIALGRTTLGALVNISLNLILIPKYGIIGAAYATLAAYFVAAFSILIFPTTRRHGVTLLRSLFLLNLFGRLLSKKRS